MLWSLLVLAVLGLFLMVVFRSKSAGFKQVAGLATIAFIGAEFLTSGAAEGTVTVASHVYQHPAPRTDNSRGEGTWWFHSKEYGLWTYFFCDREPVDGEKFRVVFPRGGLTGMPSGPGRVRKD